MSFVVSVTRGTMRHQCFAAAPNKHSARAMKSAAEERGYRDARILSDEEFSALQAKRVVFLKPECNYVVLVTWGTTRNQRFSGAKDKPDANALRDAARKRGFEDARVVDEATFRRLQEEGGSGEANPRRPHRKSA